MPLAYFDSHQTGDTIQRIGDNRQIQTFLTAEALTIMFVKGTVSYVSNVASDSGFLATIRLNKGLLTNNNKSIPYKNGLKAQAVIITKNMRLLQRLWYNINKSVSVGKK